MKPTPTPEMIEAHAIADAKFAGMDFATLGRADKKRFLERAASCLSASLSVQPSAAVVGEPVGYVSAPELVQLKMGASCVDLFREPQPGGIDFAPVYAAPSAPDVMETLQTYYERQITWSRETFGPAPVGSVSTTQPSWGGSRGT